MGSEGRGEQTVRTDQDNGLILSEPVPEADLDTFREAFSGRAGALRLSALSRQCDGEQSPLVEADGRFSRRLPPLVTLRNEDAYMNVAIFYDAEAVAGDAELLLSTEGRTRRADRQRTDHARPFRARRRFLSPRRSACSTTWSLERAWRHARPEEGRHLPDRPRRALAGDPEQIDGDEHRGAHRKTRRERRAQPGILARTHRGAALSDDLETRRS